MTEGGLFFFLGANLFGLRFGFLRRAGLEAFHAAGHVYQFLLTGIERVALGADFHLDFRLG